jgi:DNA mismatch endonuclease (patch repair protein)
MDHLSPHQRSANMRAVKRSDTAPEMAVRRLLFRAGYRYRLHDGRLPGRPDIVFKGRRKVIFVHGCFWHGHHCSRGRLPKSRVEYWRDRVDRNRSRDGRVLVELQATGWKPFVVWQCETRDEEPLLRRLVEFLRSE